MGVKIGVVASGLLLAALGVVLAVLTVGQASAERTPLTTAPEPTVTEPFGTTTTPLVLPDPAMTPGRLNPRVRQTTIRKTICKRGWTKTIRPPVGYTAALKVEQMVLYGETGSPRSYEEDHFIPLELGGAPRSPKNLWPEPRPQSKKSDPLETKLKRQVCGRLITLKQARASIRAFKFENG
jgi:hypothetical protein